MSRQRAFLLLCLIILLAVGLRSYHITARSLWFDEAFSWRLITFPFSEMLSRAAADVHPPLYYILLKGWSVVFGASLLSLRSFSILAAALSIGALFLFASTAWTLSTDKNSRSKGQLVGILTALLLALSGWQIAFAWEARMYTLGTAFVLLSSYLLIKAIRQSKQKSLLWILYGISAVAAMYVHYYALFSVFAQLLFILSYILWQSRGRVGEIVGSRFAWYAAGSGLIMAIVFAPWLPTFLKQNSQVQQQFWIPALDGWSVPDTFYKMIWPTAASPMHSGWGITLTIAPLLLTLIGMIWFMLGYRRDQSANRLTAKKHSFDAVILTTMMAVIPFTISIVLSLVGRSLYQDRYFVFAQPFFLVALTVVICRFKRPWLRNTLITLASLLLVMGFIRYWQELDILDKPGAHAASQYIAARYQGDEQVIVSSPFVFFPVLHYAQEEFANQFIPHLFSETGELIHFAGGPILIEPDIVGPDIFDTNTKTLWVVDTTGFGGTDLKVPTPFKRTDHQTFSELYGYQGEVFVNKYQK